MEKQIIGTYDALRRSFAMMALAIASNMKRDELFMKEQVKVEINGERQMVLQEIPKLTLPSDVQMRATRLPTAVADKLRARVARGDVTCIVSNPEPFTWLVIKAGHEEFRCIYGIWVGRVASWRGKIDPAKLPRLDNAMTVDEAIAKGIPVPNLPTE